MASIDDIINQARAVADAKGTGAPVAPASAPPSLSDIPNDPIAQARAVADAPAQGLPGAEMRSLPPYGMLDAAANTMSFGGLDLASGYARDLVRGQPWGQGAADYKAARDLYATTNPWSNLAGNVVGGVMAPMPYIGKAFEAAKDITSPVARWAATTGLGAGTGALAGGVTGGVNELPAGSDAALRGAEHGAAWGAGLGAVLPATAALGTRAWRGVTDWLGPVTQAGREAAVGRQILDAADDPNAVLSAGQLYGPPDLSGVPPSVPLRPSGFPVRGSAPPEEIAAATDRANIDPNAGVNLPGSIPTTAQLTGDPGLTRLEQQTAAAAIAKPAEARTPAESELLARAATQADARTAYFRGNLDPNADPQALKTAVQDHLSTIDQQGDAAVAVAQQQVTQAEQAAGIGQSMPPEARGAQVRSQIEQAKTTTKANESDLWNAIDPDGTLRVDQRGVMADARQIVKDTPQNAKPPEGEEAAVFQRALMGGSAVSFDEFTALRSRLLAAIRDERMTNGETPALRRMQQLRQSMDSTLTDAAASNFDEGAVGRYRDAADATKARVETFKNQFVGPLQDTRGAVGDYKVPDTAVGGKIITNNESAQAYLAAGGDQPTLRGALVDDLQRSLGGQPLTPDRLTNWRAKREGALRAAPGMDAQLADVGTAQEAVAQASAAKDAASAAANTGSIARIAGGDVQPQVSSLLVASPLSNTGRNAASEMMRLRAVAAGDPAATAGLQRAVMQHIDNTFIDSATGQFRTKQFLDFMATKRGALDAALGSDGMRVLDQLAADMSRQGVNPPQTGGTTRAGRVATTPSTMMVALQQLQKSPLGSSLVGAGAIGAALTGGVPAVVAAPAVGIGLGAMLARNLRAAGIASRADLLAQAMNNPALARALAIRATPANAPFIERGIQGALAGARLAPAASYDYSAAQQRLNEQRRRQLYGLPPLM